MTTHSCWGAKIWDSNQTRLYKKHCLIISAWGTRFPWTAGAVRGADRIANGKLTHRDINLNERKRVTYAPLQPWGRKECSQLSLHNVVSISNITSFLYLWEMTPNTSLCLLYIAAIPTTIAGTYFFSTLSKVTMSVKQEPLTVGSYLEHPAQSVIGDSSLLIHCSGQVPFYFFKKCLYTCIYLFVCAGS